MVYVDDFKMSGPEENLPKAWAAIRKRLDLEEPSKVGRCLGCQHNEVTVYPDGKTPVRGIEYDMTDFQGQVIEAYQACAGSYGSKLKPVDTPFHPVLWAGSPPAGAATPGADDIEPTLPDWGEEEGVLAPNACAMLMKTLYGARLARWDLLKVVQLLASRVSKWTASCDKALHRLMCYINCTKDLVLCGYVGDALEDLYLDQYADADWAGDKGDYRSTSGAVLFLSGPMTSFPLSAKCAKQTVTSYSTPESELVAANMALRTMALPALDLWEALLGRVVRLKFREDNQSAKQIMTTGKNPTMKHMTRTHGISVSWLHEVCGHANIELLYQETASQRADILTKVFKTAASWGDVCNLLQMSLKGTGGSPAFNKGAKPTDRGHASAGKGNGGGNSGALSAKSPLEGGTNPITPSKPISSVVPGTRGRKYRRRSQADCVNATYNTPGNTVFSRYHRFSSTVVVPKRRTCAVVLARRSPLSVLRMAGVHSKAASPTGARQPSPLAIAKASSVVPAGAPDPRAAALALMDRAVQRHASKGPAGSGDGGGSGHAPPPEPVGPTPGGGVRGPRSRPPARNRTTEIRIIPSNKSGIGFPRADDGSHILDRKYGCGPFANWTYEEIESLPQDERDRVMRECQELMNAIDPTGGKGPIGEYSVSMASLRGHAGEERAPGATSQKSRNSSNQSVRSGSQFGGSNCSYGGMRENEDLYNRQGRRANERDVLGSRIVMWYIRYGAHRESAVVTANGWIKYRTISSVKFRRAHLGDRPSNDRIHQIIAWSAPPRVFALCEQARPNEVVYIRALNKTDFERRVGERPSHMNLIDPRSYMVQEGIGSVPMVLWYGANQQDIWSEKGMDKWGIMTKTARDNKFHPPAATRWDRETKFLNRGQTVDYSEYIYLYSAPAEMLNDKSLIHRNATHAIAVYVGMAMATGDLELYKTFGWPSEAWPQYQALTSDGIIHPKYFLGYYNLRRGGFNRKRAEFDKALECPPFSGLETIREDYHRTMPSRELTRVMHLHPGQTVNQFTEWVLDVQCTERPRRRREFADKIQVTGVFRPWNDLCLKPNQQVKKKELGDLWYSMHDTKERAEDYEHVTYERELRKLLEGEIGAAPRSDTPPPVPPPSASSSSGRGHAPVAPSTVYPPISVIGGTNPFYERHIPKAAAPAPTMPYRMCDIPLPPARAPPIKKSTPPVPRTSSPAPSVEVTYPWRVDEQQRLQQDLPEPRTATRTASAPAVPKHDRSESVFPPWTAGLEHLRGQVGSADRSQSVGSWSKQLWTQWHQPVWSAADWDRWHSDRVVSWWPSTDTVPEGTAVPDDVVPWTSSLPDPVQFVEKHGCDAESEYQAAAARQFRYTLFQRGLKLPEPDTGSGHAPVSGSADSQTACAAAKPGESTEPSPEPALVSPEDDVVVVSANASPSGSPRISDVVAISDDIIAKAKRRLAAIEKSNPGSQSSSRASSPVDLTTRPKAKKSKRGDRNSLKYESRAIKNTSTFSAESCEKGIQDDEDELRRMNQQYSYLVQALTNEANQCAANQYRNVGLFDSLTAQRYDFESAIQDKAERIRSSRERLIDHRAALENEITVEAPNLQRSALKVGTIDEEQDAESDTDSDAKGASDRSRRTGTQSLFPQSSGHADLNAPGQAIGALIQAGGFDRASSPPRAQSHRGPGGFTPSAPPPSAPSLEASPLAPKPEDQAMQAAPAEPAASAEGSGHAPSASGGGRLPGSQSFSQRFAAAAICGAMKEARTSGAVSTEIIDKGDILRWPSISMPEFMVGEWSDPLIFLSLLTLLFAAFALGVWCGRKWYTPALPAPTRGGRQRRPSNVPRVHADQHYERMSDEDEELLRRIRRLAEPVAQPYNLALQLFRTGKGHDHNRGAVHFFTDCQAIGGSDQHDLVYYSRCQFCEDRRADHHGVFTVVRPYSGIGRSDS